MAWHDQYRDESLGFFMADEVPFLAILRFAQRHVVKLEV
jgi:hypothetical protein